MNNLDDYYNMGKELYKFASFDPALKNFIKAYETDPCNLNYLYALGSNTIFS